VLAAATCVGAATQPAPAAEQAGCSTIPATDAADPGISPGGAGYKLVRTTSKAPGLDVRTSSDGLTWCPDPGGQVFAQRPSWMTSPSYWAPELYARPVEVAVYSAFEGRYRCIGVAVRRNGVYDPNPRVCAPGRRFSLIDPTLSFAPGGPYLLYKEDPNREVQRSSNRRGIRSGSVKRIVARKVNLAAANPFAGQGGVRQLLAARAGGWERGSVEAPTLVARGGRYYLFYSGAGYKTRGYGVGVSVGKRPTGPFRRLPGNPIIGATGRRDARCGIGHQAVVQLPNGTWRLYFHVARFVGNTCHTENRTLDARALKWTRGRPHPVAPGKAGASTLPDTPAAGKTCVRHPREASVACVREQRILDVCDRDADGHRVYARVITASSSPSFLSPFYDTNDSRDGCANVPFGEQVTAVAVCAQTEGCSAFVSTSAAPPPSPLPPPPLPPAPAPARDVCASHPSDPSVVCTRNNGSVVDVCDRDPDGHRAYARVVTDASSPSFLSPYYDTNDSQPGCANVPFPSTVRSVTVCVQNEGCGPARPTT